LYYGIDLESCTLYNTGYDLRVDDDKGHLAIWDAEGLLQVYDLLQFHFHGPSEHTIDGKYFDIEMHMVYKSKANPDKLAVVGVFFDREEGGDKENEFIKSLKIDQIGTNELSIALKDFIYDLDTTKLYRYEGSLTTPPCSEVVTWQVIYDPQPIS